MSQFLGTGSARSRRFMPSAGVAVITLAFSAAITTGALLVTSSCGAHAAAPISVVDQLNDQNSAGYINATATQVSGQTFTAGLTGDLTAIDMFTAGNGDAGVLEIHAVDSAGVPTATVLGSGPIPATTGATPATTITLAPALAIVAGQMYAMVFVMPPGGTLGDPNDPPPRLSLWENIPGEYSGGSTFVYGNPSNILSGEDLFFRTWVAPTPLAPTAAPTEESTVLPAAPVAPELGATGPAARAERAGSMLFGLAAVSVLMGSALVGVVKRRTTR